MRHSNVRGEKSVSSAATDVPEGFVQVPHGVVPDPNKPPKPPPEGGGEPNAQQIGASGKMEG
jgi:hypothetical protein